MPGWLTDEELGQRLEIILKPEPDQGRPDWWDVTVADCNQAAYNEIVSRLAGRGLSPAQIAAWNRGKEYQIDIALYFLGLKGSVLEEYDATQLPMLNRATEIDTVYLTTADGTPLVPQTRNTVSYGRMQPGKGPGAERVRDRNGNWVRW